MTEETENILLHKVRVNNLNNISLEIPRDKFIVITGQNEKARM
uniref:Uncharacterized protein n=1 Tax=feces metagenome TaxID=1861841 RepID=A0A2I2K918_9ZZZZ